MEKSCLMYVLSKEIFFSPGYVVQGSNGEYAYLTPEERVELMKKVVQWVGDKKLIIAGSGCECKF